MLFWGAFFHLSSQTMAKVHDAFECHAWHPNQVKEHKNLVHMMGVSAVVNGGNLEKSSWLYDKDNPV